MSKHDFKTMRAAMVESQLRPNSVTRPDVVAALETVERERFVHEDRRPLAYVDVPIPLGNGRALNAPLATARMIAEADISRNDSVLIIGAATGYACALAAKLAAKVHGVEVDPDLAAAARNNLDGVDRVVISCGALADGDVAGAPYDVIIIDGAVEVLPEQLAMQLAPHGRLVCGLATDGVTRLVRGTAANGVFATLPVADLEIIALPGFSPPAEFRF